MVLYFTGVDNFSKLQVFFGFRMATIGEGAVRILGEDVVGHISADGETKDEEQNKTKKRSRNEITNDDKENAGTVFYNSSQVFNRDLSLVVLKVFGQRRMQQALDKFDNASGKLTRCPEELKGLRILEPLAATGLRSLRYAKELPISIVRTITASDIDPKAVERIHENRKLNEIPEEKMNILCVDANELMFSGKYICGQRQWDVVDLDPYGSAVPFLDAGVRAVNHDGLLCVTCTDMPILGGAKAEVAFYKYGGTTVKAKYIHEMALRLVINAVKVSAGKAKRYATPLISVSVDFYVRIFFQISDRPVKCSSLASETAIALQCNSCDNFNVIPFATRITEKYKRSKRRCKDQTPTTAETSIESEIKETSRVQSFASGAEGGRIQVSRLTGSSKCDQCDEGSIQIVGPFYAGPLHDVDFVKLCLAEVEDAIPKIAEVENAMSDASCELSQEIAKLIEDGPIEGENGGEWMKWTESARNRFAHEMTSFKFNALSETVHAKLKGVLNAILVELPDIPLFYNLTSLCSHARISMIKMTKFKSALLNLGYRVGIFHREPLSVKTDAPSSVVHDIIRAWIREVRNSRLNYLTRVRL